MKEPLSIPEAARVLKISRRTILNYFKKGALVKVMVGGKAFVGRESIEKFTQGKPEVEKETFQIGAGKAVVELHYLEGLFTRLGQLQAKEVFLLEYRNTNTDLKKKVEELEAALAQERGKSWLRRLFKK